jgi:hypothetical protein
MRGPVMFDQAASFQRRRFQGLWPTGHSPFLLRARTIARAKRE